MDQDVPLDPLHDFPGGPDFKEFEELEDEEEAFLQLGASPRSLRWRRLCKRRRVVWALQVCACSFIAFYAVVALLLALAAQANAYPGNVSRWWGGNTKNNFTFCSRFSFDSWDGTQLSACKAAIGGGPSKAPLIFFHGNNGEMTHASLQAIALFRPLYVDSAKHESSHSNFSLPVLDVITSSYRGFEPNTALWSSQSTIVQDAVALVSDVLQSVAGNQSSRVLVAGWSLGAAVAIQLALAKPESVAGLLVVSPFTSGPDMAVYQLGSSITPWLWVGDQWNSVDAAAMVPAEIPVAVVSAQEDHVIPSSQHRRVFEAFRSQKFWLSVPNAGHGDIPLEAAFAEAGIHDWLKMSCGRL